MLEKRITRDITVPLELQSKLEHIIITTISVEEDINDYLAKIFISEYFITKVFNKTFDKYDWENLYISINDLLNLKKFKNNGIIMEHLSSFLLNQLYQLESLVSSEHPNFEDPDKGVDLIFIDSSFKLQFYEVKSKITNNENKHENTELLITKIKNGINSIFCNNLKNVNKFTAARRKLSGDSRFIASYTLLKEILKEKENGLIDFVSHPGIKFNICIIGEEIEVEDDELAKQLVKVINTTFGCNKKCRNQDGEMCQKYILDRLKILNIVNIQFLGKLILDEFYKKILFRIKDQGVLDNHE